jgi:hypothetical protein
VLCFSSHRSRGDKIPQGNGDKIYSLRVGMSVFSNAGRGTCQRPTFKHIPINLEQAIRLPSHGTSLRHDLCTQDIVFINGCQTMDSTECITNIHSRPTVLVNVGSCQEPHSVSCRFDVVGLRILLHLSCRLANSPPHAPRKRFSFDTFIVFLTRDARAMALPSLRYFHATSMHHTSLFYSVFAGTRTLAFYPGPRKQAFVVFSRLCILISIKVLAC